MPDYSVKLSSCICSHTDSSCPGCWLIDIYSWVTIPVMGVCHTIYMDTISSRITCGAVFGAPEGLRFYIRLRTSKLFLQLPNPPLCGFE